MLGSILQCASFTYPGILSVEKLAKENIHIIKFSLESNASLEKTIQVIVSQKKCCLEQQCPRWDQLGLEGQDKGHKVINVDVIWESCPKEYVGQLQTL